MLTDQEFEQKIRTMLADTTRGLATKEELKTAVVETVDEKLADDEHRAETKTAIEELKTAYDSLAAELRTLRRTRFASIRTPDGMYKGVWGSLETARNFGMFVLAAVASLPAAKKYCDDMGIDHTKVFDADGKAMGEDYPATGGAVVPTEFIPNLIVLIESYGVFRRNAAYWPMSSESGYAPEQTGDVVVYCPGFGPAPTASAPAFRNVGLQVQKWMTLTAIDSELTEDAAIAIGEVVGRSIARAFAKKEDQCAFIGDATSTYFNRQGAITLLRAVDATVTNVIGLRVQNTAGAWSAIVLDDLLALPGLLPGYADDGVDAIWYCHKNFYYTVMIARALVAGGAQAKEITQTGYLARPTYLGRPVEFTQVMPRVKAAVDHCPLLLANLRQGAYLGDRRRMTIDQSKDVYFTTDQLGIRGTERIAPTVYGVGDTTKAGPIVGLWAVIA